MNKQMKIAVDKDIWSSHPLKMLTLRKYQVWIKPLWSLIIPEKEIEEVLEEMEESESTPEDY